jgi:hypothetical protein
MIDHRIGQFRGQADSYGEGGLFLPARYLWPLELAVLLVAGYLGRWLLERRVGRLNSPAPLGPGSRT